VPRKNLPAYEPPTAGPLDPIEHALVRALVKVFAAELRAEIDAERTNTAIQSNAPSSRRRTRGAPPSRGRSAGARPVSEP
jgi:hypothetical protein